MQLIDTHTHIYLPEFDADRDEIVKRSVSEGVVKLLMPNIDIQSVSRMISSYEKYSGTCFPMIGLHPGSVKADYHEHLEKLETIASEHTFIAVGEIGIDLYRDKTNPGGQLDAFRQQVSFAIRSQLPVVVHSREAFPEVFKILDEFKGEPLTGVLHAFSGSLKDAEKAVDMDLMLGIGGPLTFKNSNLPSIVKEIGISHLILETDSPYLAPVPFRGKRNESSYITIINRKLAEIFGISEEESASITYDNSCRLFKIN